MFLLASFRGYVETLVHPSARHDALTNARHRVFIGSRILCGLIAIAAFPVFLVAKGIPSPLEAFFFGWLLVPLLNAFYLSRTGRYEVAHMLASLALTTLIVVVGSMTGGISSSISAWLIVVPLEAALSASRRAVLSASIFAITAGVVLTLVKAAGLVAAAPQDAILDGLGILSAALYAAAVALRAEALARKSSRLLSVEEDRYRLLARNMTDVITRHGRNGAVMFASPAAEPLFGSAGRDLMGHGLFDRVHVADRPAYLTALADSAAGESRSVEFRVKREQRDRDGRTVTSFIWIEMRCRPLDGSRDESGALDRRQVVAVMREMTDRKAQELAICDARAEAERANAAKSHFLATMSHELRTPLNAVIGFSELLMNEETMNVDSARRKDYARLIHDSGHHLLSVVNDVLDMSKIESDNFEITPEPFEPSSVVANCCELLALKARDAGVELKQQIASSLPEIVADKRAVRQILLNLVSNAIKFTQRNGRVTVAAHVEGQSMCLIVSDTGVGIGEEDLVRVGEPFFQARNAYTRSYEGAGLGLSIVKGLVALHGGSFEIRSRKGEGASFTVRLPLDCESAPRRESARVTHLPPPASTLSNNLDVRKRA